MCNTSSAGTGDAKGLDGRCACRCEVRRENAAGHPGERAADCCAAEWENLSAAPGGAGPGHGPGVLKIQLHLPGGRGGCCRGREAGPSRE